VLATAFVLVGLVQTLVLPIADPAVAVLYVVGSTAPLAWRRTHPVGAALVSSVFWLVPLDGYPVLGFVVVLLMYFALGYHGRPDVAVLLTTVWSVVVSVAGTLLGPEQPVAAIGGVLAVVAPVAAGRVVRRLRDQNDALAELTEQLARERARAEESAVARERARISQELHDVVGHELTLIAIQAEAAGAALRAAPERAAAPVEAIRETAHRTLAEIRATLDVLAPRATGGESGTAEAGDSVPDLVRRAQAAGMPVVLGVTGEPWPAQTPAALAVSRIVQECLTNARRHAPEAALDLHVTWTRDAVHIRASNALDARTPSPDTRGGRGLTGMRHRAELLGGAFAARSADGRFEVDVTLPAEAARVAR
jgi:signal transduction histidine kinase